MLVNGPRPGQSRGRGTCFLTTFILAWASEGAPLGAWLPVRANAFVSTTLETTLLPSPGLENVARGQRCEPRPSCSALLDGDTSHSALEMMVQDASVHGQAHRPHSFAITYFKVYLEDHVFVAKVMIFCAYSPAGPVRAKVNGTNGSGSGLAAEGQLSNASTKLAPEEQDVDESSGDALVLRRILTVTTHVTDAESKRQQRLILVRPQEVGERGTMQFDFEVNEMATAVTVEWGSDPGAENGGSGCCGHLHIAEVKVLGHKSGAESNGGRGLPTLPAASSSQDADLASSASWHQGQAEHDHYHVQKVESMPAGYRSMIALADVGKVAKLRASHHSQEEMTSTSDVAEVDQKGATAASPTEPPSASLAPRRHSRGTSTKHWVDEDAAEARILRTTKTTSTSTSSSSTKSTSTSAWNLDSEGVKDTTPAMAFALSNRTEDIEAVMWTAPSSSTSMQEARRVQTTLAPAAVHSVKGGTVATMSSGDGLLQPPGEDGFLARHARAEEALRSGGVPVAIWLIGMSLSLCAVLHFWHYHSAVYAEKQADNEAAQELVAEAVGLSSTHVSALEYAAVAHDDHAGPSFFYIGSESEDLGASSHTEDIFSARQAAPTRSPSDSEPEKELDPGSPGLPDASRPVEGGSAPSGAADTRDQSTRSAAEEVSSQTCLQAAPTSAVMASVIGGANRLIVPALPPVVPSRTGRLVLLYASPLCYETASGPKPIAQLPVEKEYEAVLSAHRHATHKLQVDGALHGIRRRGPGALISAQTLTAASLQRALTCSPNPLSGSTAATVLHLSAHGFGDRIVLEDGRCTAHFLGCDTLKEMLAQGGMSQIRSPTRLVVINACSLRQAGLQFAEAGVPHVICCKAELLDKASHVFLEAFYSYLFEGGTVKNAFDFAKTALFNHRDSTSPNGYRNAAESLELLPAGANHSEVLFHPESPTSSCSGSVPGSDEGDAPTTRRSNGSRGSGGFYMGRASRTCTFAGEASTDSDSLLTTTAGSTSGADGRTDTDTTRTSRASGSAVGVRSAAEMSSGSGSDSDGSAGREGDASASEEGQIVRQPRPQRRGPGPPVGGSSQIMMSGIVPSPFSWSLPPVPEDFLGRSVDIWSVARCLTVQERRAVVVCAAPGQDPGIGKTAVLDAVHRVFVRHIGWTCISARLRAGLEDETGRAWIGNLRQAVQAAKLNLQDQLRKSGAAAGCGNIRRYGRPAGNRARATGASGRTVSRGFHPLSAMLQDMELEELLLELSQLAELCEVRSRDWAMPTGRILLILDECDHLIQSPHFQEKIDDILRRCSACRIVLSTHQRMVVTAGGWFKVVHQQLQGLDKRDQARLFLRRAHRPLQWSELIVPHDDSGAVEALAASCGASLDGNVMMSKENEAELLNLIASHPAVAAQRGNPRCLIELANQVSDSLPVKRLSELIPAPPSAAVAAACSSSSSCACACDCATAPA
mmetsp:Transcript_35974/g.84282  ORF Transcript_35974/g.84282 Transcript_35974/m.84282 type:complete len:1447 (-) Transcript_35974:135-4475(-)